MKRNANLPGLYLRHLLFLKPDGNNATKIAFFVAKAGKNRSPDPVAIADEIQKEAIES